MEPFIGEIQAFPYTFVPRGWFPCDGRSLSIQSYSPLFALIGVTYGGDGRSNFYLPNLIGRVVNSQGQGPSLSNRVLGEVFGTMAETLNQNQMPSHNHGLQLAKASAGQTPTPAANLVALDPGNGNGFLDPTAHVPNTAFAASAVRMTGGNAAHPNNQPTQVLCYCIAYEGIFPSFP